MSSHHGAGLGENGLTGLSWGPKILDTRGSRALGSSESGKRGGGVRTMTVIERETEHA